MDIVDIWKKKQLLMATSILFFFGGKNSMHSSEVATATIVGANTIATCLGIDVFARDDRMDYVNACLAILGMSSNNLFIGLSCLDPKYKRVESLTMMTCAAGLVSFSVTMVHFAYLLHHRQRADFLIHEGKKLKQLENEDRCPICLESFEVLSKVQAKVVQMLCCEKFVCKNELETFIQISNDQLDSVEKKIACLLCRKYPLVVQEYGVRQIDQKSKTIVKKKI